MASTKTSLWRAVRLAGMVACGQCAAALVPVEVSNPGFEDGTAGWSGGRNMAIDEQVAHGGRRSISLTVDYPRDGRVYITRQVPVTGGAHYTASCFVKTENVTVPPGYKSSVGAGLIVEWADKNGKWMQGGQYACERRGTTDWTKVTCDKLKAPDAAGYACIFLALRDSGKAWFDDFTFARVEKSAVKTSPANGATLADNTPRFAWEFLPGARRYTLELSRDPAFAPGKTLSFAAGGFSEFRLETPLEPGTWHWRVNAAGLPDAQPWSFAQTAPLDRDCLPPLVLTKAVRLTDSGASFAVQVKDASATPPLVTFGAVTGACAAADAKGVRTVSFKAPAGGWPKGFTEGEIVAVDAAGNREAAPFWLLNSPRPDNGVTVEKDGCYWQNGKRIFPLGIYEVAPKYMDEVRKAGYDVVHTYRWEGSQDDKACRKYLDQCWAADGLRAFIGFDRGAWGKKGMIQGNIAHLARRVGALADHPGLFCWYLFDEPEVLGQFITPDKLTEYADLVRTLDPYHPVVMTTWNNTMNEYRRTWDTHWTQAYGDPAGVVRQIEEHRRFLLNASPITLLVNCNDGWQGGRRRKGIEPDPEKFARDYDHLRACAFLGIVKECNGLWWWWFARDRHDFYSASQVPKAWENLVSVVKEIGALRPLVTADGPVATGTVKCGDKARVEWWVKTVDGKATLIAVNTAEKPVEATIPVPGAGERKLSFRRHEVKVLRDL